MPVYKFFTYNILTLLMLTLKQLLLWILKYLHLLDVEMYVDC